MLNFNTKYDNYLSEFSRYLDEFFDNIKDSVPEKLFCGIEYSVKNGGKRLRPVLCLAVSEMLGVNRESAKRFALAIELIHSYSLVHDDLPAMDDDDYRRGVLSTHKKFGEANGILIGDALLNLSFEVMLSSVDFDKNQVNAAKIVANCSGALGMIKGQFLDINKNDRNEKDLLEIDRFKTSKLISAAVLSASALSGNKYYDELSEYAYNLGMMFQFSDDVLDEEGDFKSMGKTLGKDKKSGKTTAVSVFGLNGAKSKIREFYDKCINSVKNISGADFLRQLAETVINRRN